MIKIYVKVIRMFIATIPVQDVNQAFLTKKKVAQNSADAVSSSVSSSSSKFLLIDVIFKSVTFIALVNTLFRVAD